MVKIFAGERGLLIRTEGLLGDGDEGYHWTGLEPTLEARLRREVAKAYRTSPDEIEIFEVTEFAQYFVGDESFGEVRLRYKRGSEAEAIWGICGPEDRSAVRFVCFAD